MEDKDQLPNEINAIKLAVMRSLKKSSYNCNSKLGIMNKCFIDIPLSKETFKFYFAPKCTTTDPRHLPVKCDFEVQEFDSMFGDNWAVYRQPNSTTQQRILGKISLLFRKEKVTGLVKKSNRLLTSWCMVF